MNKKKKFVIPYSKDFKIDETLITLLPDWLNNFKTNRETTVFKHTLSDLPVITESALIVDHPFTGSFERQAEVLKDYEGTIFCCDRCLLKCIQYGVIPDYVVNVDSSYLCVGFYDLPEVRKHMNEITAIFAVTTFPLTIRAWTGKKAFFTPIFSDFNSLTESVSAMSKTDIARCGGCVHNTCWAIAYTLGAKTIGLYGIDNSYNSLNQTELPKGKHYSYYVKELDKIYYTDYVYKLYAEILFTWLEHAKDDITAINTTENGIMYNSIAKKLEYDMNIKKMTLKEFVEGCK